MRFSLICPPLLVWLAIHLSQNTRKHLRNAKKKLYSGVFCITFFVFCILQHFAPMQCQHSHKKSKEFLVYFFPALIKHKICMKYEKCIVNVSYFVVCFVNTLTKYRRNAKYDKCIAGLLEYLMGEITLYFPSTIPRIEVSSF